jgi:hypothetical protein
MGNNCRPRAPLRRTPKTKPLIRIDFIFVADSLADSVAQERRHSRYYLKDAVGQGRPTLPIRPRQKPPRIAQRRSSINSHSRVFS